MWRHESVRFQPFTPAQERRETSRLEALSDGVFAIAMTLLVLSIPIPTREMELARHTSLMSLTLNKGAWLPFLTYVLSFVTILVMWVNHHSLFQYLARIDRFFVFVNGLLLMMVVFVNYPTALVANFVSFSGRTDDGVFAAAIYSGTLIIIAILYQLLWNSIIGRRRLLAENVDQAEVSLITRQYRIGAAFYVVAFALAFVSPALSVAVTAGLAVFFAFTGQITRVEVKRRPGDAPPISAAPHS
jgi:uncharacterized membrane protein